jgi:hypothetical protein
MTDQDPTFTLNEMQYPVSSLDVNGRAHLDLIMLVTSLGNILNVAHDGISQGLAQIVEADESIQGVPVKEVQ